MNFSIFSLETVVGTPWVTELQRYDVIRLFILLCIQVIVGVALFFHACCDRSRSAERETCYVVQSMFCGMAFAPLLGLLALKIDCLELLQVLLLFLLCTVAQTVIQSMWCLSILALIFAPLLFFVWIRQIRNKKRYQIGDWKEKKRFPLFKEIFILCFVTLLHLFIVIVTFRYAFRKA